MQPWRTRENLREVNTLMKRVFFLIKLKAERKGDLKFLIILKYKINVP